jgi:hypothetical protein
LGSPTQECYIQCGIIVEPANHNQVTAGKAFCQCLYGSSEASVSPPQRHRNGRVGARNRTALRNDKHIETAVTVEISIDRTGREPRWEQEASNGNIKHEGRTPHDKTSTQIEIFLRLKPCG